MGEVYKALDTRLDRIVAIKQLTSEHRGRFEREARAVAALNHPNICQVYDVGPDYLVLEYLEGQPVRGPLPPEDAVRVAIQIAGALQAAHEHGILHRDLKPANIMVTAGGTAKLLDFGVAKRLEPAADVTETTPGAVLGTPAYMSPEQVEGQSVDARSDIFSFGAVLYEILAGRRPFAGNTTSEVIAAILRDDPPPLGRPPALERVVMRCLAKKPADRYQTMAEVSRALEDASLTPAMRPPSIAVLPFANLSGDKENEYFSDGLAEEIINELTRIPGLKVIARTSAFAFKGRNEDVRGIAEALGVTKVLEGSVRRAGDRIRVTAQLISAADGTHMWSERYDRSMADVFAIQDEIAQSIAKTFRMKMARKAGLRGYTPALPAYEAFLRGRDLLFRLTPDSWARAKGWLDQAIELDPAYADPHMVLGLGHLLQGFGAQLLRDVAPTIRAEAYRALALNPSDPQPHILLGSVAAAHDYDWNEAAERFRDALKSRARVGRHAVGLRHDVSERVWPLRRVGSRNGTRRRARSVERRVARGMGRSSGLRGRARPRDRGRAESCRARRETLCASHHAGASVSRERASRSVCCRVRTGASRRAGAYDSSRAARWNARPAWRLGPRGQVDPADGRRPASGLGARALSPGLWGDRRGCRLVREDAPAPRTICGGLRARANRQATA